MITRYSMKKQANTTPGAGQSRLRRRIILLLVLAAAFAAYVYYGNTAVTVTQYDVSMKKIPPGFDGFRIVQISDLHNSHNSLMTGSLVRKTAQASPDMIVLTGDMIDSYYPDVDSAMSVIGQLNCIAPVYYVIGNHEARTGKSGILIRKMKQQGISVLSDSYAVIRVADDEIVVAGVNDPRRLNADGQGSDAEIVKSALGSMDYDRRMFSVLLSHRPELMNVYATYGVDLVLTGHAHGGLIRLPFIGGLYAPHQGLFPTYCAGLYTAGGTQMIVNRGTGNSGFSFRINDPPELVVTVLHAG